MLEKSWFRIISAKPIGKRSEADGILYSEFHQTTLSTVLAESAEAALDYAKWKFPLFRPFLWVCAADKE